MEPWLSEGSAELYATNPIHFPDLVYDVVMQHLREKRKSTSDNKFDVLLDAGCGNGEALRKFLPYFQSAIGFDISEEQITLAKTMTDLAKTKYFVARENSIPAENNSVDLLISIGAAHYMDIDSFVAECKRVLKDDGLVALSSASVSGVDVLLPPSNGESSQSVSGNHILEEYFLRPLHQYHSKVNHPYLKCCDNYLGFYNEITGLKKYQASDIDLEHNVSLAEMKQYFVSMPTYKVFNDLFDADVAPLKVMGDKLKEYVNETGISDIDLRLKFKIKVFYIFMCK
uniref:uncharacterized protein LOC120342810 n=1 Tax=Styela clava TaxID=7725 RepID=UPI00193A3F90|nr:uncharacterized protein LOC120342810 [Styela clava]